MHVSVSVIIEDFFLWLNSHFVWIILLRQYYSHLMRYEHKKTCFDDNKIKQPGTELGQDQLPAQTNKVSYIGTAIGLKKYF